MRSRAFTEYAQRFHGLTRRRVREGQPPERTTALLDAQREGVEQQIHAMGEARETVAWDTDIYRHDMKGGNATGLRDPSSIQPAEPVTLAGSRGEVRATVGLQARQLPRTADRTDHQQDRRCRPAAGMSSVKAVKMSIALGVSPTV